jgi:hypothetical protein
VPSFPLSFWDQHFAVAVADLLWAWVFGLSSLAHEEQQQQLPFQRKNDFLSLF